MRRTRLGIGLAVLLGALAVGVDAQDAKKADAKKADAKNVAATHRLPRCPVANEAIDFNVKTDTESGPVYFCCAGCIDKYKADPAKFEKEVAKQRGVLAKMDRIQVACPLSGEPIDKNAFVEQNGKKVYLCCNDCKTAFAKNPKKYAGKLAASYTYQTKCPVGGGKIDPAVYSDLPTGERIYYCCPGCDKKFKADPAKYVGKLAEQGVHVDAVKLAKALEKKP